MLALYLLLFREAKQQQRWPTAHRAGLQLRALLQDWGTNHHLLRRCHVELTRFIIDNYLGAEYEKADVRVPHRFLWPEERVSTAPRPMIAEPVSDLPATDLPTTPRISPGTIENKTSSSATRGRTE